MNPKELTNSVKEMAAEIAIIKEAMVTEITEKLKPTIKSIFDMDSRLKDISWTQYTPYFNDGDTCEFSRNDLGFNGVMYDDYDEDSSDPYVAGHNSQTIFEKGSDGRYVKVPNPKFDQLCYDVIKTAREFFNSIPDDIWLDLYGDHVKITITNNDGNIEITESNCDHE